MHDIISNKWKNEIESERLHVTFHFIPTVGNEEKTSPMKSFGLFSIFWFFDAVMSETVGYINLEKWCRRRSKRSDSELHNGVFEIKISVNLNPLGIFKIFAFTGSSLIGWNHLN
jgi:hypothetical protein